MNPKSSRVSPVSPANKAAAVLNCSVNGDIEGVVNWPTVGLFPSESPEICSILDTVAFHVSSGSASESIPNTYFWGNE